MIVFARHDLLSDPPFPRIDLIIFRDRLADFVPTSQKKIIEALHYSLAPAGSLLFESQEIPRSITDCFKIKDKTYKIYAKPGRFRPSAAGTPARGLHGKVYRHDLQTAIEELQSANEELESIQEQLESTNEALVRSHEEALQLSDDLVNLLASIQIPIVMVDRELRIQRFTPTAKVLLNIVDADVGRRLTDLDLKVDLPYLPEALSDVMETQKSIEREVQDRTGHWYNVQVRPYKTREKTRGAVVAMTDIDQLKRDRDKLRLLVELSFEPIIVWDFEKGIIEWNRGCEQLYGFSRDEAIGRNIHELLHTVHPLPRDHCVAQLQASGEWKGELHTTAKDGREVIVESRKQTAEIGGRTTVLETNHDITESKRAQVNAQFINQLDLAMAQMTNADEIVRWATHKLGEQLNADRCHLSEIDRERGLSIVREGWEGWLRGAQSIAGEYRIGQFVSPDVRHALEAGQAVIINDVTTDPRTREFVSTYAKLGIAAALSIPALVEGRWEATLTVAQSQPRNWRPDEQRLMRDTALRIWLAVGQSRSVAALRESEVRARRTLAEQMVAGVAECDASGKYIMVNQRYCDITGRSKSELLNPAMGDITYPGDWPHNAELYDRLFASGESFFIEKRYRRKDGSILWVNSHVSPIRNAEGKVEESVAVVVDVTERKRAEEELRAALERAESATRAKDEFLSLVSHELRTPLVSILGYTQLLRVQRPTTDLIERVVDVVERNSNSQLRLIEDVLDTTRIISGKLKLEVQPLDLAGVINAAIDVVRPSARAKGVELRSALDPGASQITGDPERLQQVVWNLLSNAVKFTPGGGLVEVTLRRADPYVEIVVRDTGKGIDPEFLPHLFERFTQSDRSSTRRTGGLGLGLSLVKHLVGLHGGDVEAASAGAGPGSIFTIRLPVRAVYTPPPLDGERERMVQLRDAKALAGMRALVVDDEQDVRTLLTMTLESCGADVQTASSAKEALALLAGQFDVLISDIAMPDEDGYELIRTVRASPPEKGGDVPAIALTAHGRAEDRERALKAGFQMYAAKPVSLDELVEMILDLTKDAGVNSQTGH